LTGTAPRQRSGHIGVFSAALRHERHFLDGEMAVQQTRRGIGETFVNEAMWRASAVVERRRAFLPCAFYLARFAKSQFN